MLELLIVLLPVAAVSGWYSAFRYYNKSHRNRRSFGQAYVRGIHYLLNEKPDRALDAFTDLVATDQETTEFHVALGNFFRRRGEVEKAIQIHQNLTDKPSISQFQLEQASFELGRDFLSAGLYDRAETIFIALTDRDKHKVQAMQCLLHIYQQEKDWLKAIEYTRLLEANGKVPKGEKIAHFFCELAIEAQQTNKSEQANQYLQQAKQGEPDNIRVNLLDAKNAINHGQIKQALAQLQAIAEHAPAYIPTMLPLFQNCYERTGNTDIDPQIQYFQELYNQHHPEKLATLLATLIQKHKGTKTAIQFMSESISRHPSITSLNRLIDLQLTENSNDNHKHLQQIRQITSQIASTEKIHFHCNQCGFNATELHWRCPGCCHWDSIQPNA